LRPLRRRTVETLDPFPVDRIAFPPQQKRPDERFLVCVVIGEVAGDPSLEVDGGTEHTALLAVLGQMRQCNQVVCRQYNLTDAVNCADISHRLHASLAMEEWWAPCRRA
jgi:hypothetical protein